MSKKKKSSAKAPVVATPNPANEYIKDSAGNIISQRVYDPTSKSYTTQNFESASQRLNRAGFQGLQNRALEQIQDPNAFNKVAKNFEKQYYASSVQPIIESSNQATQQGIQSFGARGMLDSAGFANYLANQVERNKQQALQTAAGQSQVYGQDAAGQAYNRNLNNLQVGGAGLSGLDAQTMAQQQQTMAGANSTNAFNQNNAQIQLQNAANNLYAQQMNQANNQRSGLLGRLFG